MPNIIDVVLNIGVSCNLACVARTLRRAAQANLLRRRMRPAQRCVLCCVNPAQRD